MATLNASNASNASNANNASAASTSAEIIAASSSGALITSRSGIVGRFQTVPFATAPRHLDIDDRHNLELWDRDIRISTVQQELFRDLSMSVEDQTVTVGALVPQEADTDESECLRKVPVVKITRPEMQVFLDQLPLVHAYSDLRNDRAAEILAQVGEIMSFIGQPLSLHPQRHRWTIEFLFAAVGAIIEMYKPLKHVLAVRRPSELSPQIQPMITTPAHSAFPSGHAMEAFAMAEVLAQIVLARDSRISETKLTWRTQMMRQAHRVAVNRTVAGVHYPIDSMAGGLVGIALGKYVMARATNEEIFCRLFNRQADASQTNLPDFDLPRLMKFFATNQDAADIKYYHTEGAEFRPNRSKLLYWMLAKARGEWWYEFQDAETVPGEA